MTKNTAWAELRNPDCELCVLHKTAQAVCLIGDGPKSAEGMIIGEAPGKREDNIRVPFSGRAGQFLDECLEKVGLDRGDLFITNVVHCRPPDNRTPTRAEAKVCVDYTRQEIDWVAPSIIFLLGNTALRGIAGRSGITKYRGTEDQYCLTNGDMVQTLPTYHPAAILRNPRYLPEFMADLERFAHLLGGGSIEVLKTRSLVVDSRKKAKIFLKHLREAKVFSYDIETNNLLDELEEGAEIWVVGFCFEPGTSWTIPIDHPQGKYSGDSWLKILKPYMEDTSKKMIAHNAKFDNRWLKTRGIEPATTFDTMLASYALNENEPHGLEPLSALYLKVPPWKGDVDFPNLDELAEMNGKDCDYTLRLYEKFRKEFYRKENYSSAKLFLRLLMPAAKALERIEALGVHVLIETFHEVEQLLTETVQTKIDVLNSLVGHEVNWNSPKQVAEFLYSKDHLGLPIIAETPKGQPSTAEGTLIVLKKSHYSIEVLLDYRKFSKYLSTYINSWWERIREDGRLHPRYLLHGTVTGRLSSRQPNLQQVPRDPLIRQLLGAEEGWTFVQADYSQIELRIAAFIAQEDEMLRAFQTGEDIHLKTARIMTGKEEISSEERKKAKAVNFGLLYGMGAKGLQIYAMEKYEVAMSLEEAIQIRNTYFRSYPRLKDWHKRSRQIVRKYHMVRSLDGRIRRLPDILSFDESVRAEAERQAINSPVQGFASDLMLMSLIQLNKTVDENVRIVGSVHDSLLFEIRQGTEDLWIPIIKEVMENPELLDTFQVELTVPIEVEVKVGDNWGHLEKEEVK